MAWMNVQKWDRSIIGTEVRRLAVDGVMPTAGELRSSGRNDLAVAITRYFGSYDECAERVGLALSSSDTRTGWKWETWAGQRLEESGMTVEARATVKAPFDLLVNGHRVDVKYASKATAKGSTQWTWRISKEEHACDFYLLIAESDTGEQPMVFVRPAADTPKTCSTMRRSTVSGGLGRMDQWKDRIDLLR